MAAAKKPSLYAPGTITMTAYKIGGPFDEVRYTVPATGFEKLVGVARMGDMVWIAKGFAI